MPWSCQTKITSAQEEFKRQMSQTLDQQQQQQLSSPSNSKTEMGMGSVGPVIAVLVVITVLGIVAGVIGRLCTGRKVLGYGQYDVEGWIETKCSSCIDGRLDLSPPPPVRPNNAIDGSGSASVPVPEGTHQ